LVYVPGQPPFSARQKPVADSLITEEAVTTVTRVTETSAVQRENEPRDESTDVTIDVKATGNNGQSSEAARIGFADLVTQWVRERRTVGIACSSTVHALHCSFCQWARLMLDADVEDVFADELRRLGFVADASGLVSRLIVIEDLVAALRYERAGKEVQSGVQKSGAARIESRKQSDCCGLSRR